MPLSNEDLQNIKELMPFYGARDVVQDLKDLASEPKVLNLVYRAPDEKLGHKRHYLEIHTDDIYYYDFEGLKRSNLGKFIIGVPLDEMSKKGSGQAEDPKYLDYAQNGPTGAGWGGGIYMRGEKSMEMPDYTREGGGLPSFHPHTYGGGARLCLGGFAAPILQASDHDLISFYHHALKFLREGGRRGDDGEARVSMYSNCIKHIFKRHSESVEASDLPVREKKSQKQLLDDLIKSVPKNKFNKKTNVSK